MALAHDLIDRRRNRAPGNAISATTRHNTWTEEENMAEKQWFNLLGQLRERHNHRRALLRKAGAVLAGWSVVGIPLPGEARRRSRRGEPKDKIAAEKNRGRNKGKSKRRGGGKHKDRNKPVRQTCSGGRCQTIWRDDPENRDWCEFICEQCDGDDSRAFCIVETLVPDGVPNIVAVCCGEGNPCCGNECCSEDFGTHKCCGGACIFVDDDPDNCGRCGNRCAPGHVCRHGNCNCESSECDDPDPCATCQGADFDCCGDGRCIYKHGFDRDNCGGCDIVCGRGLHCIEGECRCADGYHFCPQAHRCINSQFWECCGTAESPAGGYCGIGQCCESGDAAWCTNQITGCP
jgi:hypothetical protein